MRTQPIRRATITTMVGAMALCVAPPNAFATRTATLTHTEFVAQLGQIKIATATSEASGWVEAETSTSGTFTFSASVQYDPTLGRSSETFTSKTRTLNVVAQAGIGTWQPLPPDPQTAAALRLLHQPSATYLLNPDATKELQSVQTMAASVNLLKLADVSDTAQVVTNDDGTIDYSGTITDPSAEPSAGPSAGAPTTWGLRTSGTGVLISESEASTDTSGFGPYTATNTVSYGAQTIALPAASDTVTQADLTKATNAVRLPQTLRAVADRLARAASTLASHAHRGILPSDIVAAAKRVVAGATVHITVTVLKTGVRLSAVNPYSHAIVANTVLVELAPIVH